jgi:Fibronectin type III domain
MNSTKILYCCSLLLASIGMLATSNPVAASQEPINVTVTSGSTTNSAIISWSDDESSKAAGYRVQRRVNGGTWRQVEYVKPPRTTSNNARLASATTYEYSVVAFRKGGIAAGYQSSVVSFTTPPNGQAAISADVTLIPRRVDAQPSSPSVVYVTWKDVTSDETGFRIERRISGGNWGIAGSTAPNQVLYKDTTATANTSYEYRVTALRNAGNSAASDVAKAKTPADLEQIIFVNQTTGNDKTGTGKESTPFQTIQKAVDFIKPGMTVLVGAGVYTKNNDYAVLKLEGVNGTENAWITFKNFPGEQPRIRTQKKSAGVGGNNHGIIMKESSYIVIDGFEIEGHLKNVTQNEAISLYNEAKASYDKAAEFKKNNPSDKRSINEIDTYTISNVTDASGITVVSGVNPTKAHHIIIRNNTVFDHPGGGINSLSGDYVVMEYNRVYNVGAYSPYGASGINYYQSANFDDNATVFRQIIRGNVVSEVRNLFPCNCAGFRKITDGNGIILDKLGDRGYTGNTLITNNIVFNNGGRGIHTFKSLNAFIYNNTSVNNGTLSAADLDLIRTQGYDNQAIEGEITTVESRNVRIFNNIMVAGINNGVVNPAYAAKSSWGTLPVVYDFNIIKGGAGVVANNKNGIFTFGTANKINTDPQFLANQTGLDVFKLTAGSPAVNASSKDQSVIQQSIDVFSAPRIRGGAADAGAIESF